MDTLDLFGSGTSWAFILAYYAVWVVSLWTIFAKAGRPGWAALIPFYNAYTLLKTVGRPGWWLLLYLIPFVNIVVQVLVSLDLAHSFGRGTGFGIGLLFLPIIFLPILGFGSARYEGPGHSPRGLVTA